MSYYKMLDNVHVIIRKKGQFNFWEQELYKECDFSGEACLDVHILLKEGLCQIVKSDEEKNEE